MPEYQATVEAVNSRAVKTRDGRESTVYEIIDGNDIKWETWKKQLASEANRLMGQQAIFRGKKEINGEYTNYRLEDVQPVNGSGPNHNPVTQAQRAQTPASRQAASDFDTKDWSIMRQCAGKVSAHLSDNPIDFWRNLDALVAYFAYGLIPPEYSMLAEAETIGPTSSYESIPNADDDIPF
jgi:hypothetical protein